MRQGAIIRVLCAAALLGSDGDALAQAPSPPVAVQPFVRNWTRFEMWRHFDPPPPSETFTPGDPSTTHVGNRLQAGVRMQRGFLDATVALQYVQFGNLPANAIGPVRLAPVRCISTTVAIPRAASSF